MFFLISRCCAVLGYLVLVIVCLLQQLECLTFSRDGREFISSHSDGSYIIWTTDEPNFPREPATTPYGNFCSTTNCLYRDRLLLPWALGRTVHPVRPRGTLFQLGYGTHH